MLLGVASEPVPAVVGTMTVKTCFLPRVGWASCWRTVHPAEVTEASFAMSITLPPPTARIMSAPAPAKRSMAAWAWSQVGSAGRSLNTS